MSAFMCSENHIGALVRFWCDNDRYSRFREIPVREAGVTMWQDIFGVLATENQRSLLARYPGDHDYAAPPSVVRRSLSQYPKLEPVSAIKQAQCFEYQACEHDGWEKSEAHRIIQSIVSTAIHMLPGYDSAPWGI